MKPYAVILHHNRHKVCGDLVRSLSHDGVEVVVVDNSSFQPFRSNLARVIHHDEQPPNLSKFWNMALNYTHMSHMRSLEVEDYAVAILNDDLVLPEGFVGTLARKLDEHDVDIAFPDQFSRGVDVVDKSPPRSCLDLTRRMTGYAFVMRGSAMIRADERLKWWAGDVDLEMKARQGRGTVLVGGIRVEHLDANGHTDRRPELSRQAGVDRETFREIWGFPDFE